MSSNVLQKIGRLFSQPLANIGAKLRSYPSKAFFESDIVGDVYRVFVELAALRLPIIIACLTGILFALPGQTQEIFRSVAQIYAAVKPTQPLTLRLVMIEVGVAVLGIVAVGLAIWLVARRAASRHQAASATDGDAPDFSRRPALLTWGPRLLAVTPLLFTVLGLHLARVKPDVVERLQAVLEPVFTRTYMRITGEPMVSQQLAASDVRDILEFNSLLLYFSFFLLFLAAAKLFLVSRLDGPRLARALYSPGDNPSLLSLVVVLSALAASVYVVTTWPVSVPQMLGPIFLMSMFLVLLQAVMLELQIWRQKLGVPFALILIIAAVTFSAMDWNDNHPIRAAETGSVEPPRDAGVDRALERWIESRQDRARYGGSHYPLYIVAAQGGGIYAAKHAASFLAEVQDLCPGFAHHLFAISGVSGGSVGAAVFAALTMEHDWARLSEPARYRCIDDLEGKRDEYFQFAVTELFRQDLWSPLAASLLFPDLLQRFLPVAIPAWDRARWLDYAIEDAFDRALHVTAFPVPGAAKRPLVASYLDHWNPERNPHTPALLFNTTEVGNGKRRVVSPFSFSAPGLDFLPVWRPPDGGAGTTDQPIDPPLSTAAGLSARFPWITPSAHFIEHGVDELGSRTSRKIRLVDGAYFENSGAVTALDLIRAIEDAVRRGVIDTRIEINLLVFTSIGFDRAVSTGLGEAIDPIRTMFNTRTARASIAIDAAISALGALSSEEGPIKAEIVKLELNGYGYPLPLGWRLSPVTRHLISLHNGAETECEDPGQIGAGESRIVSASCAKRGIYDRLR